MTSRFRVLVEQPTKGKRWVAVAADWPGLERGAKTEDEAVEKLVRYVPRYLPVAKRVRLGSELESQTDVDIIGRYQGVGSTDFWGISFAPVAARPRAVRRADLRSQCAAAPSGVGRVRRDGRPRLGGAPAGRPGRRPLPGPDHPACPGQEGGDFSKRVKVPAEYGDLPTPAELAEHRDRFVEAMRAWYEEGKKLGNGNWTIPYLLRHAAYHVLDHTWEMQDRDLTNDV